MKEKKNVLVMMKNQRSDHCLRYMYLDVNGLYAHIMANCKLPYKLICYQDVENNVYGYIYGDPEKPMYFDYNLIKQLSEDEEHTYFFIIDASVSELMIERNPALRYLPFFPVKINEKSTKKSQFHEISMY